MEFPESEARWRAIRSAAPADPADPLLLPDPPGRCGLRPLRDPAVYAFRERLERLHWLADEVDLSKDAAHFAAAAPEDRRLVAETLGFFNNADHQIMAGLEGAVLPRFPAMEPQMYFRAQIDQEATHADAYALQVEALLPDDDSAVGRRAVRRTVLTNPAVAEMAAWVRRWCAPDVPPHDLVVALAFIEGCLFSGFFGVIRHYSRQGRFPGVGALNDLIARDEGVHTDFWVHVHRRLRVRADPAVAAAVARETAALSAAFFDAAMPAGAVGINAPLVNQYVQFIADALLADLGEPPVFRVENPLAAMEQQALNSTNKSNFFEHTPTEYQGIASRVFALDTSPIDE